MGKEPGAGKGSSSALGRRAGGEPKGGAPNVSPEGKQDLREVLHELETLKSGLETRDEELREVQAELAALRERLKEETERHERTEQSLRLEEARLETLLHLSRISESTLAEMAEFALERGITLTRSEIGFLGFLSEDEAVYTLHAVSKDVVKECDVTGEPVQWHIAGAGIWADAIRERRTLFVNDYRAPHPRKTGLPPGHPPVERFMVVPVFEGKRIVAVAGVGNKSSDYDRADERQIALLLSGMWGWLQTHRSREALKEAYTELEHRVEERTAELSKSNIALQESEKRYRALVENAPVGMYEIDLVNVKFTSVNDVVCDETGYSREELLSMNALDLLEEEHKEIFLQRLRGMMSGQEMPGSVEYKIRMKSGRMRWGVLNVNFIREGGIPVMAQVVATDLTERKQAEERRALRNTVTGTLADAGTLAEAAPLLLEHVGRYFDCVAGELWLVEPSTQRLRRLCSWEAPGAGFDEVIARGASLCLACGEGFPGNVWASGEPVWMSDFAVLPEFPRSAAARREGVHSLFGFPIRLGTDVLGVLLFAGRETRAPDPALLQVAEAIGSQIGQFIQRRQAEEALRESYEELSRFNRAAVDRELRMIELKKEINELYAQAGRPRRYALDFEEQD